MNIESLEAAIFEAERFLGIARRLKEKTINEEENLGYNRSYITASKESGATRRASMDLTRALATLRGRSIN